MKMIYQSMLAAFILSFSSLALAYVGPGAGLTAIGSILAFVGAILLLILGFLWYPIKRFLKGRKKDASQEKTLPKSDSGNPE